MSDLVKAKRERLEKLKKEAAEKRRIKELKEKNKGKPATGDSQRGNADDIDKIMDNVMSSSAFEERKKKEEEDDAPKVQKVVDASLTIALDQCEHSINPAIRDYLNQPVQ